MLCNKEPEIKKWRIFRIAKLITPEDETKDDVINLAVTISNTKYSGNTVIDEEWLNFYSANDILYEIHLSELRFIIYHLSPSKRILIFSLSIIQAPSIRIQRKDTTVQLKYYLKSELKIQITFYTCEEAIEFNSRLNNMLKNCYENCQCFIDSMNKLNCGIENVSSIPIKCKKSMQTLLEEYCNLLNK